MTAYLLDEHVLPTYRTQLLHHDPLNTLKIAAFSFPYS